MARPVDEVGQVGESARGDDIEQLLDLQLQVKQLFDVITSRAFADLSDFVNWSGHLLAEGGQFIALKGVAPPDERERLPSDWKVSHLQPLAVPGLDAERHLVFIRKTV